MKLFWILMAVISQEGTDYEVYKFDSLSFKNEMACISFAQENYPIVNNHVNEAYNTELELYDFACVSSEEYKQLLAQQETE